MPRAGEITYLQQIGEVGREHALGKPFSDVECGNFLMRVGQLMKLIPSPPARILECGCGTGWLSYFLAKTGYQVVATDVCQDAIQLARANPIFSKGLVPDFRVMDSELLEFQNEFDAVIFFDSLHHAVNEEAALESAYRALRPGGVCVMMEPGWGHHRRSLDVEEKFGVTEKDMPPTYLRRLGKKVGFRRCRIFPAFNHLGKLLTPRHDERPSTFWKVMSFGPLKYVTVLGIMVLGKRLSGTTVLAKAA